LALEPELVLLIQIDSTLALTHVEHLWQDDAEERATSLNLLLQADSRKLIAGLDPLCRAILVLRSAIRLSIQDCVLRLNVSRAAGLAANCLALTRLRADAEWHLPSDGLAGARDSRRYENPMLCKPTKVQPR
jgi:hypothetical protein